MTRLLEVSIATSFAARAAAERAAYELGAQGVQILDEPSGAVVRLWLPAGTSASAIRRRLIAALGDRSKITARVIESWQPAPRARPIGGRFVLVGGPPKRPRRDGREAIVVEHGTTFGDGSHPTTRACVALLESIDVPASVLDVGTGTGVLAIVASRLGAEQVVATDVDPLARAAARRAMRENEVDVRVAAALPRARFDLVIANLYRDVLLELAPALRARVAKEGNLLVSGFAPASLAAVCNALGASPIRVVRRGGWCAALVRLEGGSRARPRV